MMQSRRTFLIGAASLAAAAVLPAPAIAQGGGVFFSGMDISGPAEDLTIVFDVVFDPRPLARAGDLLTNMRVIPNSMPAADVPAASTGAAKARRTSLTASDEGGAHAAR